MASWEVEFDDGAATTMVDLKDVLGPFNDWTAHDSSALIPASGTFTNQLSKVVPSVQPTWILDEFDIDSVAVGDTGPGDMKDNDGTFPTGEFTWRVTNAL